jgi:hypothetical protein
MTTSVYEDLNPYFGDIHSHNNVGYGHGSMADSFHNARLQLDFAAITHHAHWPDLPVDDERLADLVAYHKHGFERTREQWSEVRQAVEENYQPGKFVTFLAFEWHSLEYGDHNVYFNGSEGEIIYAANLEEMREALRAYQHQGIEGMVLPHHIGYKQGYRGVNWSAFTQEFSPVVEIMSMHGASESTSAPYPYLHTMGPRDWHSFYQYGLAKGHLVGVVGSTDHHSAHPGSYGHGRLAVWAKELTREAVWEAIRERRTVALTGDNIQVKLAVNEQPIGSVAPPSKERQISVSVEGCGALDYVEVIHNNQTLHRRQPQPESGEGPVKVHLEVGWGKKDVDEDWEVDVRILGGQLLAVEPRFRGHEIIAPQATEKMKYAFSDWAMGDDASVHFTTRTWGNSTTTTASTQGICLTIMPGADTAVRVVANGVEQEVRLRDLLVGPYVFYLGGFMTPAVYLHRAVPNQEWSASFELTHQAEGLQRDWYYVRVRQTNGQWAWSSPVWVMPSP